MSVRIWRLSGQFGARDDLCKRCQQLGGFGFRRHFKHHLAIALSGSEGLRIVGNDKGRYNAHSLGKISGRNFRALRHANLVQDQARRLVVRARCLEKVDQVLGIAQAREFGRRVITTSSALSKVCLIHGAHMFGTSTTTHGTLWRTTLKSSRWRRLQSWYPCLRRPGHSEG